MHRAALRLGTDLVVTHGTVCLTNGVTATGQGRCFFVIHGHAPECLADVQGRAGRIGIAVHTFWVHIDQTHMN